MAHDLPPLGAVVTFEAAARNGSFTSAARELVVTHGAVSRAVASLQAWLGVQLFRPAGRGVELTEKGRAYLSSVSPALDQLAAATARLRRREGLQPLVVEAPPTLTVRWLIPRLPLFHRREPSVEVRIRTAERSPAGRAPAADVTLRRGPRRWPGFEARRFLDDDATPVAAPRLLRSLPLRTPADLARHTLIHASARPDAWTDWLRASGAGRVRPAGNLHLDHFYLALQAAVDGLGVAMGPLSVIADDLAARRLAAPFGAEVLSTHSYYALTRGKLERQEPHVRAFVAWLAEAAHHPG